MLCVLRPRSFFPGRAEALPGVGFSWEIGVFAGNQDKISASRGNRRSAPRVACQHRETSHCVPLAHNPKYSQESYWAADPASLISYSRASGHRPLYRGSSPLISKRRKSPPPFSDIKSTDPRVFLKRKRQNRRCDKMSDFPVSIRVVSRSNTN